jgi:hypothetical protein
MEVTVADYRHLVLVKGAYQIRALTQATSPVADTIAHYAVATSAGDILRCDLTLYEALAWLELLLEESLDQRPRAPRPGR